MHLDVRVPQRCQSTGDLGARGGRQDLVADDRRALTRLRQELARRGVDREAVAAAIDEMLEEADVAEAAVDVARPRWRALAGEADPRRRRQKTLEFLVRRGFDYDDAREAVIRVATEDGADDPVDEDAS